MTAIGMDTAITLLRRAGLTPTQRRLTVAGLALSGPLVALTAEDLRERAHDADLCLGRHAAEETLAELRAAGILPQPLPPAINRDFSLNSTARMLQAMANPCRLAVLRELIGGERCVGDLLKIIGIQQSALSQHLARLRADNLVRARREATRIYYSLATARVKAVLRLLDHSPT
jgi:DNA-binding transcriptional ArsR family regulator